MILTIILVKFYIITILIIINKLLLFFFFSPLMGYRYVAVGNEPFLKSYNGTFNKATLPALQNIDKALKEAGHSQVKGVVPLNADVYDTSNQLPSGGAFRSDIKHLMKSIAKHLQQNKAPFVVNIYPFISLSESTGFPMEFAFFDKNSKALDDDGNQYHNLLDASYDTLAIALKKIGTPNLKIVIGEIGWPTDGNEFATKKNAQAFYYGLFNKLKSKEGTPLFPKVKWDIFLFGWLDEDTKSIDPGYFERHWGIFYYDGKPKFPIDFNNNKKNKWPVGAKGVEYLDRQWCILDKTVTNSKLIKEQEEKACREADCSNMEKGGSCSKLDNMGKTSYAFNQYYQLKMQNEKACDFEGTAMIVKQDPTESSCIFPIQFNSAITLPRGATAIVAGILLAFFALF